MLPYLYNQFSKNTSLYALKVFIIRFILYCFRFYKFSIEMDESEYDGRNPVLYALRVFIIWFLSKHQGLYAF